MSKVTKFEAIQIFKQRCDDLRDYAEFDIKTISDRELEAKILWRKSIYDLNKRLLEIFTERSDLH